MNVTDLIAECHRHGVTLAPALDYEGPDGVLDGGLEQQLRDQKVEVIRELVGPAGGNPTSGPRGPDWRFEWLREVGMLALRWRDATDSEVKALLRELLAETPRTLPEWLILGEMIRDAEADLRRAGKLPPVPNFEP
jgi:hypothetical protein